MPTYDYKCPKCEKVEEYIHSIKESPSYECPDCKGETLVRLIGTGGGFTIKGGSPAIHYKEKRLRYSNREKLLKKQAARWSGTGPKVKPNIAGHEVSSWSDAKKMAKEAGMNTDSYTPWVEKEKKK